MNRERAAAPQRARTNPQAGRGPRSPRSNAAAYLTPVAAAPPNARHRRTRVAGLDALRGCAIVAMVAYHVCFDLRYFGVTRSDFEHDAFWLASRSTILSAFLLIAGVSAALARRDATADARWPRHV